MLENYLLVAKNILPDYFEKVLEVRHLMESGKIREVSQAVKVVGISRSTYYKYKDFIMEPYEIAEGRKAVLSMMLTHEAGVLSAILANISEAGGSVLTITQSLPIRGSASVTISLDISEVRMPIQSLVEAISAVSGAENVRLVAVE